MLHLENITKVYAAGKRAVDGLSLDIGHGVLGLLGPNGAGKSSLMEILAANLDFEEGCVTLNESIDLKREPGRWREHLGYLPQTFDFPSHTTGHEILEEAALLLGFPRASLDARIDALLHRVNLDWAARRDAANYSRGMKQRLGFALAVLHDPLLLLLDEPTAGLDPVERVLFRDLLAEMSAQRIVILSTHIVADVERCCSTIAVLDRGRLRYAGHPGGLVERAAGFIWECRITQQQVDEFIASRRTVSVMQREGTLLARVVSNDPPMPDARSVEPTLEDAYFQLLELESRAEALRTP